MIQRFWGHICKAKGKSAGGKKHLGTEGVGCEEMGQHREQCERSGGRWRWGSGWGDETGRAKNPDQEIICTELLAEAVGVNDCAWEERREGEGGWEQAREKGLHFGKAEEESIKEAEKAEEHKQNVMSPKAREGSLGKDWGGISLDLICSH